MSERQKPLNVRVAEAVGLKVRDDSRWCEAQCVLSPGAGGDLPTPFQRRRHYHEDWKFFCVYEGECGCDGDWIPVRAYCESWTVTGPVLEERRITVLPCSNGEWLAITGLSYPYDHATVDKNYYCIDEYGVEGRRAAHPLLAACLLIANAPDGQE